MLSAARGHRDTLVWPADLAALLAALSAAWGLPDDRHAQAPGASSCWSGCLGGAAPPPVLAPTAGPSLAPCTGVSVQAAGAPGAARGARCPDLQALLGCWGSSLPAGGLPRGIGLAPRPLQKATVSLLLWGISFSRASLKTLGRIYFRLLAFADLRVFLRCHCSLWTGSCAAVP